MLKRGCYQGLRDGLKESLRYLYDNPTKTYEDLVEKVIQINGEKSGRQSVVSKSGIIDREPQTSDIVSQEMPDSVQELVKSFDSSIADRQEKGPTGKREASEQASWSWKCSISSQSGEHPGEI